MLVWHEAVCERARNPDDGLYRCFHCEKHFPRDEVCGDHFPHTRGARPDLKYDPDNGVCSCMPCNTSGSPDRARSLRRTEPRTRGR